MHERERPTNRSVRVVGRARIGRPELEKDRPHRSATIKPRIVITSPDLPGLSLESIDENDLERLRHWKNAVRDRFFFQDEISATMQRDWYAGYLDRPDDWMFVIRSSDAIAGCIGYRILGRIADLYNVLREPSLSRHSTAHTHAFDLLTNYIAQTHEGPIGGEVLVTNPANRWFHRRGFRKIGEAVRNGLAYNIVEQDPACRRRHGVVVERSFGAAVREPEAVE